jgi:hypothetical protein
MIRAGGPMTRRLLAASLVAVLAGCQDYNFNPVGQCIVQPGSARIQLSGLSTADILFVVDDSGSMASEQKRLADNFGSFITALAQTQAQRKASGLDPLEFHIAIATSSVFEGWIPSGAPVCGQPTANTCLINTPTNGWSPPYQETCAEADAACVDLITNYWPGGCPLQGRPYPAGNFVVSGSNAPVLHFDKTLAWETWQTPSQDPRITALVQQFKDNINVGVCGSGMEQHFEAGRLAVQKALAGTQPGLTADEWPHPGAKMVVVWVGDEDDCSNPKDATRALGFTNPSSSPGNDVCTQDEAKPAGQRKMFPVQDYVDYFTNLGRPFSAAFIYSSDPASCQPDAGGNIVCTTGTCACQCPPTCTSCGPTQTGSCQIDAACGGKSTGSRFHDMSAGLRAKGITTLDGSVCDWNFGQTLERIADLVKPPAGLTLPTQPAASQVAVLRIEGSNGSSRLCTGPGPTLDWQFVDCKTGQAAASGATTSCITINHDTGHCEANPGETYIAQYLGVVPAGGCAAVSDCAAALGGPESLWTCEKAAGQARGTCLCASGG